MVTQNTMSTVNETQSIQIQEGLRLVIADSYALLGLTHLCHWNVEGPGFFALHQAFEEQYTELFQAVDDIAERIRAIGGYAPGGLSAFVKMANIKEVEENAPAAAMVKALAAAHQKVIKDAVSVRDAAGDAGDAETEDLMIARIQVHEKTVWMLESYLKG
jgi:starvation-inducible DNA-binding protein